MAASTGPSCCCNSGLCMRQRLSKGVHSKIIAKSRYGIVWCNSSSCCCREPYRKAKCAVHMTATHRQRRLRQLYELLHG